MIPKLDSDRATVVNLKKQMVMKTMQQYGK